MKKFKKAIVLMMAIAMVFAMSATAFAAEDGVNVKIQMYGETYIEETVNASQIAANLPAGQNHLYTVPAGATHDDDYTAADAMIQAYVNFYGNMPDSSQVSYYWSDLEPAGIFFTVYDGISADAGNYYFVGTSVNEEGETLYEYYWAGDSWTLYIDGDMAGTAASNYKMADISEVVFDYNTVTTENFTTTTEIPGALPAE